MEKIEKTSQLRVAVGLNKENIPIDLQWDADDRATGSQPVPCKAMLLSLFERETLDTIKIDLWTADMQVNEMDRFFFQTLRSMADTYFKATQNRELAVDMQRFVQYFGEKTGLIQGKEA